MKAEEHAVKNKEDLGILFTWMMPGGHEVDIEGEGPLSNNVHVLDFIIQHSIVQTEEQETWEAWKWGYV